MYCSMTKSYGWGYLWCSPFTYRRIWESEISTNLILLILTGLIIRVLVLGRKNSPVPISAIRSFKASSVQVCKPKKLSILATIRYFSCYFTTQKSKNPLHLGVCVCIHSSATNVSSLHITGSNCTLMAYTILMSNSPLKSKKTQL